MSSKPKQADYQPSASDKASASVAMAEYEYFKQQYDPLLRQMRDKSMTEDVASGLRGRANADVMQALSGPSYEAAARGVGGGDLAQALQGQTTLANVGALDVQNTMRTNVLGTARGQAADAQTGMAQASRLGTSEALARAKARQDVAQAKYSAAGQVAGAALYRGMQLYGDMKNPGGTGTVQTPPPATPSPASFLSQAPDYTKFGYTPQVELDPRFGRVG
jgi:hypothetical protein